MNNEQLNEIKIKVKTKDVLPINYLTRLQGDLKILTQENYLKLKNEILTEGFCFAIHVWENKDDAKIYILDGHQRYETLTKMKEEGYSIPQIPVVFIEADNINDAKKILLGGASQYGEFNQKGAEDFISTIEGIDIEYLNQNLALNNIDYGNIEFKQEEEKVIDVQGHQRTLSTYVEGEDDIPEVLQSKVKLGDIFQLGNHRLMCGDSTLIESVEKLMDGQKADMVFTDPPYGMKLDTDYSSMKGWHQGKKYKPVAGDNDDFKPELIQTMLGIFSYCSEVVLWGADYYAELLPDKNKGSWAVWDKRVDESKDAMYGSCFELCWSKNKHKRLIFRKMWAGFMGDAEASKRLHPTQKPTELITKMFGYWAKDLVNIVDLFGGSGSTLIACEKTNRKCFMMELDPHYCGVIIERWQKFTSQQAMRINQDSSTILYDDIKQTILRPAEL